MSDVRWICLSVNLFNNDKIKIIRKRPDGDHLFAIWIRLLCIAGNCNSGGLLQVSDGLPYDIDMLSTVCDDDAETIQHAVDLFARLGMLAITDDNCIVIKNWDKYQHSEKLEKLKEQNRNNQTRYRRRMAGLQPVGGTGKSTVYLTEQQSTELLNQLGVTQFDDYITRLVNYLRAGGTAKDHYQQIKKWVNDEGEIE